MEKIINIIKLEQFLEDFKLSKKVISNFTKNKRLLTIDNNIFLIENSEKIQKNQVYQDLLLFLNLDKFVISSFLLNFINKNSENILKLKSEKTAVKFTYSKDIEFKDLLEKPKKMIKNQKYLVKFNENILGFIVLEENSSKQILKNEFNIGNYLKEN